MMTAYITLAMGMGATVAAAVVTLAVLGAVFGLSLYLGSRVFAVEVDPRIEKILDALPGANCGACGLGGCRAYAEGVVLKGLDTNLCAPGGEEACHAISEIMGVEAETADARVAAVHCKGDATRARERGRYAGVADCRAALVPGAGGGAKLCPYGCLGLGTCVGACPFGALVMGPDGLAQVIEGLCTGCGKCVAACPRGIIQLHSRTQHVFVMCSSHLRAKQAKAACDVGCIACKRCEKACDKFDGIKVVDNLPVIDDEKCRLCAKCVKVCPTATIWSLRKARKALDKKRAEEKRKKANEPAEPCPA
ncbi:MAG: RnfABCDGE type electron transport complex subunit B [Planctomycetota bacterium]|jgi:electron transport complex protein RnfB